MISSDEISNFIFPFALKYFVPLRPLSHRGKSHVHNQN